MKAIVWVERTNYIVSRRHAVIMLIALAAI